MIPGGGPELLFRSFAVATGRGRADARGARGHGLDRAARLGRGARCCTAAAASTRPRPRRRRAASASSRAALRARTADVTRARGSGGGDPQRSVPHGGRVARGGRGASAGRARRAARAAAGHRARRRLGAATPHPHGQERRTRSSAPARAAEIAEVALAAMVAAAAPGRTLAELAQVFRREVAEAGADLEHVAISPFGLGIATVSGYPLRERDVLLLDVGCLYRSCVSDTGVDAGARAARGRGRGALRPRARLPRGRRAAPSRPACPCRHVYRRDARRRRRHARRALRCPRATASVSSRGSCRSSARRPSLRLADDIVDLAVDQTLEPGHGDQPRGAARSARAATRCTSSARS